MREAVLLTGGTGMVGRTLAALLLQRTSADVYLLIHQNGGTLSAAEVLQTVLSLPADREAMARLTLLHGDIARPGLGLQDDQLAHLTGSLTHILHAAASTRFDLPLEQARRTNVAGTENVAHLALACGGLRQFGFLSTVYVSGKRTGQVEERPPIDGDGFVNTYEQSKCEAEIALSAFADRIPLAVYRLSTVVGHSRTGEVTHFTAPHQALRVMHLGLGAMVPGKPDYVVDLISSDHSAASVFQLFWEKFAPNRTYHITHGAGSFTLREVIESNYLNLARADAEWGRRNYPMPAIVPADAFELFMESALAANNAGMVATLRALDRFARQFVYPKQFERTNVLTALPDYETSLPDIRDYYGKVVDYCLRTRWGKVQ